MNIKKSVRSLMSAAIFVSMLTLLFSCGGGGGDSGAVAGQSGTITLTASVTSIPADGTSSAIIHAEIRDSSGEPVRHYTEVTFITSLGNFRNGGASYTMRTQPPLGEDGLPNPDAPPTGIAEAQFIAGMTAGSAKITVNSNGVSNSVYISLTGGTGAIVLSASPSSISADGKSSSTITASLTDSGGNPVTPGTEVTFMTGLGHFQNGGKTYTVATSDDTGSVQVALHAGVVPGTTYIVATSKNVTQSTILTLTNVFLTNFSLSANPVYIAANGTSTSVVTATIEKSDDGTPVANVPITFYNGTGSSEPVPIPPDNTYKGTGSTVTSKFYSYGGVTTFTMIYTGPDTSNFAVWLWNADTEKREKLLVNKIGPLTDYETIATLAAGNHFLEVMADGGWEIKIDGNIAPGEPGETEVLDIKSTNANGEAEYTYRSTFVSGEIKIKAETGEVSASQEALSKTVTIVQTDPSLPPVEVTAEHEILYANGLNSTVIEATVRDAIGAPVPDGTVVTFSATAGTLSDTSAVATAQNTVTIGTSNGVASVKLTSVASATTIQSKVTATVGANSSYAEVFFLGVSLVDMLATPPSIFADGKDTSEITVRLKDDYGAAIPEETVIFVTTGGTLTVFQAVTDDKGIATTTLVAPAVVGTATITAYYGTSAITTSTTITFEASGVGSITLTANPTAIPADGASSSTITATLKDSSGSPVPKGTSVNFSTNLGSFSNSAEIYTVITPDETGIVAVALIAGITEGSARITVSAINTSQSIYVYIGGQPVSISLTANPTSIPADGISSSTITATLKDSTGAPVTPGTSITFKTSLGTFSNGSQTIKAATPDATGIVSVSLISSTTAGAAEVTAEANGVIQSIYVTFGGTVGSISLVADPESIPADGISSSTITATLKDSTGTPVTPGTSITFTTDLGTFAGGGSSITVTTPDTTGIVSVSLISASAAGFATITARSGAVTQSVSVGFTGGIVGSIVLTADPTSIPADGSSSTTITAIILDTAGNPVPAATSATFTTTLGTFSNGSNTLTITTFDDTGKLVVALIAGETAGSAEVVCSASGVRQKTTVQFTGGGGIPSSLSLGLSQTSVKSDNSDSATVTATVLDVDHAVVSGVIVGFTANGGQISASSAETDENGQAKITFSSGTVDKSNRTVTITAKVTGLPAQTIPIQITGSTLEMTGGTTSLKVDATDTLTITAKDAGGTAVYNAPITLTTSGPQVTLSAYSGNTSVSGQLAVTVTGKTSGSVTITATWSDNPKATYSYTVGTSEDTFEIVLPVTDQFDALTKSTTQVIVTGPSTTISFVNANPALINRASGSFASDGYKAGDKIMVGGSTSNNGLYTIATVAPGSLTLITGESLTDETAGASVTLTNAVLVRVHAPTQANVVFSTTIGVWDKGVSAVITKAVSNQYVWAVLSSPLAGSATVQVYDASDTTTADRITVAFSAPSGDAGQITLQSNTYAVAPSVGDIINSATLTATVRTSKGAGGQVVKGAAVAFSIVNPTGGGETVSPVVVVTDSVGEAKTTFTSGSLSTGAEGVTVTSTVVGMGKVSNNKTIAFFDTNPDRITRGDGKSFVTDGFKAGDEIRVQGSTSNDGYFILSGVSSATLTLDTDDAVNTEAAGAAVTLTAVTSSVNIVIGGTAGSVVIGRGSEVGQVDPSTYSLPMSVLVTDSNGNPVAGAVVSLSSWPEQYSSGVWFNADDDQTTAFYQPYITGTFPNEDKNENLILDPGEDTNGDGKLTPPSSAGGSVPDKVTTDENGVATFNLVYLKSGAVWILDRIRASTFVLGTETTSSMSFRLPYLRTEGEAGDLPDSAYPIGLTTGITAATKPYTFSPFGDVGSDNFKPLSNLSAGSSVVGYNAVDKTYFYVYTPTGGTKPAKVGDVVWDYITASGKTTKYMGWEVSISAYFPIRTIMR